MTREKRSEHIRTYHREYVRKRREAGLCVTCGLALDATSVFKRCSICRDKSKTLAKERRQQTVKTGKSNKIEMANERFGRLLVVKENGRMWRNVAWLCLCDCGKYKTIPGQSLRTGRTQSCGCLQREKSRRMQIRKMSAVEADNFFDRQESNQ